MSIAAQALLKDWTREQWQKAIEDMKAQPSFWHGMDFGSQPSKTYFNSSYPMNFKLGDNVKFKNNKFKVINIPYSTCIEVTLIKRKSKGYRKHIRRIKSNAH